MLNLDLIISDLYEYLSVVCELIGLYLPNLKLTHNLKLIHLAIKSD